jgi:hypothetical protein
LRLFGIFSAALLLITAAEQPVITLGPDGVFRVSGLTQLPPQARLAEIFLIKSGPSDDAPAMLGSHSIENGAIVFRPRYPLQPGVRYRARFLSTPAVTAEFLIPKPEIRPTTRVEQIYPTASSLPENQLKLYIHFSAPMSIGEAWRHLKLLDSDGKAIELPFLEIQEELWDLGRRRLTVLFDPGRVKRGLVPNKEVGPPLVAGRRYTLLVERDWQDAAGAPMAAEFRKDFRAVESDRTSPDPSKWRIATPAARSRAPLSVEFPEPLDHSLLERLVTVEDAAGRAVPGEIAIDREETRWRFTPDAAWAAGEYRLVVGEWLEDLAGNRPDKVFDVDLWEKVDPKVRQEYRRIGFRVEGR